MLQGCLLSAKPRLLQSVPPSSAAASYRQRSSYGGCFGASPAPRRPGNTPAPSRAGSVCRCVQSGFGAASSGGRPIAVSVALRRRTGAADGLWLSRDQASPRPGPGIKRPRSMALAAHVFPKRPQSFPHNRGYLGSEISRVLERTEHYSVSDACSLRRGQLMPDLSTTPLPATILVACPTRAAGSEKARRCVLPRLCRTSWRNHGPFHHRHRCAYD